MSVKILAYYLPQFHEVEQNNEWWCKGFTEWFHVRNAKSLYKNHIQPKIPLNSNYYDLSNKETVEWQTDLCKKYGVYGFVYYHYWNLGNLILEKPAENLLKWKDIPQNFCFMWANHSWYKAQNGKKHLLFEQQYGNVEDWENHYLYLASFFKDERYIKIDNKPVFGVYVPADIPDYNRMLNFFNEKAKLDGFDGIYFIESLNSFDSKVIGECAAAGVIRQPNVARSKYFFNERGIVGFINKCYSHIKVRITHKPRNKYFDYKRIAELEAGEVAVDFEKVSSNKPAYYGISSGWDNTPRHGKFGQYSINVSPEVFGAALSKLVKKSKNESKDFVFINAWNEWAEGMYLEPDEQFQYSYLETIRDVMKS